MLQPEHAIPLGPKVAEDRRTYERTPVALFGRCMFENKVEIPCQAINMSPGDLAAIAAHEPKIGEHVIFYLDNIGRLSGEVVRIFDGGFAITIEGTARKREKLASQIAWLKENVKFGKADLRRHDRIVPNQRLSDIRLEDGRSYPIEIIDISLSGAAIKSEIRPAIGTPLTLGGMQGKVVRHFPEGIAIQFSVVQSKSSLRGHIE